MDLLYCNGWIFKLLLIIKEVVSARLVENDLPQPSDLPFRHNQSKDPNPTIPTYRLKKRKRKIVENKKG